MWVTDQRAGAVPRIPGRTPGLLGWAGGGGCCGGGGAERTRALCLSGCWSRSASCARCCPCTMVRRAPTAPRPTPPTTGEWGQTPCPSIVGSGKRKPGPFPFPAPHDPTLTCSNSSAGLPAESGFPFSALFLVLSPAWFYFLAPCLISRTSHQGASQGHVLPRLRQLPGECLSLRRAATSYLWRARHLGQVVRAEEQGGDRGLAILS